jgi:5-methylcytosine-specific restriction endonuclease McrA
MVQSTQIISNRCTYRTSRDAGWADHKKLPKGPNGRALCRQCGVEVPKGRLTFCSDSCVDEWKVRTNPGHARRLVFNRDHGVCAICGLDTERLRKELRDLLYADRNHRGERLNSYRKPSANRYELLLETPFTRRLDLCRMPWRLRLLCNSFWEMDHIIPVIEGGGCCGLSGLRTLCWRCHARETRYLKGRRAGWEQLELPFR